MAACKTPFSFICRVYYADTDAGGVVYHANYLNFMERTRVELLRELGHWQPPAFKDALFVVRSAELQYLAPARLDDELRVTAEVMEMKRSSVRMRQQIIRSADGQLLCEGHIWLVHVDTSIKPRAIPEPLRQVFAELATAGD